MAMYLKIAVTTDAKEESVRREGEDRLILCVKEPAEDNRANARVLEIVRRLYPNEPVRLVSGHHSPRKVVLIGRE